MAKRGQTVAEADFPLYTVLALGDRHLLVAGGGGPAKTGVPNCFIIYRLVQDGKSCNLQKVCEQKTGDLAVMNGAVAKVASQGRNFTVATGEGGRCQLYSLRHKMVTPRNGTQPTEGVRKRKSNLTKAADHSSENQVPTFDIERCGSVESDTTSDGGFQKVVRFTRDNSIMVTGGADGYLRTWEHPSLKSLYTVKAQENEIDDLDIHPLGKRIVTVCRDSKAYLWHMRDGKRDLELHWQKKTSGKYRFRNCRFGIVIDKKDQYCLFTTHIPCVRGKTAQPCYLSKWDTQKYFPQKTVSTGTEVLSAFAVSDDGIYLGLGTISGSVFVHIAFSLLRLYRVREAHGIFVTEIDFAPNMNQQTQNITGNHDFTLFSVSADRQVKVHQQGARTLFSFWWAVAGFVIIIYLMFWLMASLGI